MDSIKYKTDNAILALLLEQQEIEEVKQEVGLVSNGDGYETHSGKFFTTDDIITLRDKAAIGLGSTKFTGIVAKKYDGLNDGQLVFDADGYARVGDEGSLQMIATREDAPLINGIAYYDNSTRKFKTKTESSLSVGNADNANKLGDVAAANYARTDIDETFTKEVTIQENLNVKKSINLYNNTGDSYGFLNNDDGKLLWQDEDVYTALNSNKSDVDWTADNGVFYGNVSIGTNTYLSNGILKLNSDDWIKHTDGVNEGWEIVTDGAKDIEILRNIGIINHRDTVCKGVIGTAPYISGLGGKGTWRISQDANAEFDNLDIREGLTCNTFTNNKINISNGDLIVSDTDTIEYVDGNILYFSKEQPFRVGDILRCQGSISPGNIKSYYITVASEGTSETRTDEEGVLMKFITFTDKTGSGTIETDDILLRWNSSDTDRKGLLYMSSSSTYSPFYDVIYDGQTKARFGRLDGITTSTGKALSGYGSWAQNGFFEGWLNAEDGLIGGISLSDSRLSTPAYFLDKDGTASFANGAAVFNANGSVVFSSNVTLTWDSLSADAKVNLKGESGADGTNGTNGVTTYTWIKYADTSVGGGLSNDPTGKTYIGFAYNKTTATESNTTTDYTWSLIKGIDGQNGTDGIAGANGSNGQTYWTWIKYSNSSDGTSLYDTPNSSTLYIGIAVNQTSASESTDKTKYVWSRFKGETGDQGLQGVKGDKGADGVQRYTWIKYADSSTGSGISNTPTGKTYIGFAYNKTTATESNTTTDYTWSLMKGADGTNGTNGVKGDQGVRGSDGADGTPRYTWIKYSNYSDGTSLYDTPTASTLYIGIATNKTSITESATKTDYKWSLFRGSNGTNGINGTNGAKGDKGDKGNDGVTPYIQNGYWYLNGSSTGVKAIGINGTNGATGAQGIQGVKGNAGPQGATGAQGPKGDSPTSTEIKNTIITNAAVITPTIISNMVGTNRLTASNIIFDNAVGNNVSLTGTINATAGRFGGMYVAGNGFRLTGGANKGFYFTGSEVVDFGMYAGDSDGDPHLLYRVVEQAPSSYNSVNVAFENYCKVVYNAGNLVVGGTFSNPSDRTLKENIVSSSSIRKLTQLNPVDFTFKPRKFAPEGIQHGFIAQELQTVYPELVNVNSDGTLMVNYIGMISENTAGIISNHQSIEELKSTIEALKIEVAELTANK
ncbi:tail fiber domain-containing protein [Labilibaculum manganireducens]|uniref:tail fiber domain-containing protein n=1 Tax=Labilibaculum manganireducens TaxID=1940525 RepID=UPI0029F4F1FA|nr:tail fiber domain-containing protein [Labilibaculum manganireducens]